MNSLQYLVAYITGPDENTPPTSFQNVVFHNPKVISAASELRTDDIISKYLQTGIAKKPSNAIAIFDIKFDAKMSSTAIELSFSNDFTYEKILYIACQPNSFLSGAIRLYTSDDSMPLENIKVPCVSSEYTEHRWTATLDI